MRIDLDGQHIVLFAPRTSDVIVREIPGTRWNKEKNAWLLPLSWASCVAARGILGSGLEVRPRLAEWARAEQARRITPALSIREAHDLPGGWDALFARVEGGAV